MFAADNQPGIKQMIVGDWISASAAPRTLHRFLSNGRAQQFEYNPRDGRIGAKIDDFEWRVVDRRIVFPDNPSGSDDAEVSFRSDGVMILRVISSSIVFEFKRPNQAPEPTPPAVTPPAGQEARQP